VRQEFEARIERLIARFNGAIKYTPMLQDHGEGSPDPWDDDRCVAYAREHHARAIEGLRQHGRDGPWNNAIPYCRNMPTDVMLSEAGNGG